MANTALSSRRRPVLPLYIYRTDFSRSILPKSSLASAFLAPAVMRILFCLFDLETVRPEFAIVAIFGRCSSSFDSNFDI
jgi:hypothetical protein